MIIIDYSPKLDKFVTFNPNFWTNKYKGPSYFMTA